jgi:hypothetical protein
MLLFIHINLVVGAMRLRFSRSCAMAEQQTFAFECG